LNLDTNGRHLFSSSRTSSYLWDLLSREKAYEIRAEGVVWNRPVFSLDGSKQITTSARNNKIPNQLAIVWESKTGKEIGRLDASELTLQPNLEESQATIQTAVSDDGKTAVTGFFMPKSVVSQLPSVDVWDTSIGKVKHELMRSGRVSSLFIMPDGKHVIVGESGNVKIFDLTTGQETASWSNRFFIACSQDEPLIVLKVPNTLTELEIVPVGVSAIGIGQRINVNSSIPIPEADSRSRTCEFANGRLLLVHNSRPGDGWYLEDLKTSNQISELTDQKSPQISISQNRVLSLSSKDKSVRIPRPVNDIDDPKSLQELDYSLKYSRIVIAVADKGEYLGELIPMSDGHWVAIDASGRFDATSPEFLQNVGWWNGETVVPIADLESEYAEPGLLAKLMGFDNEPVRIAERPTSVGIEAARQSASARRLELYKRSITVPADHDNLLSLVNLGNDWNKGNWKLEAGHLEAVEKDSAIEFPYTSPDEYRMTAIVEPLDNPFSLLLSQRMGEHPFLVTLAYNSQNSIEMIDGVGVPNESTHQGQVLRQGETAEIVVTVKKDSVQVSVDGKQIIHWSGDASRLSLNHKTPNPDALAIHTNGCRYRIHRLSIEPLSGQGRFLTDNKIEASVSDRPTK
jgi:hypothetical protein